jgi:hypothetical protein
MLSHSRLLGYSLLCLLALRDHHPLSLTIKTTILGWKYEVPGRVNYSGMKESLENGGKEPGIQHAKQVKVSYVRPTLSGPVSLDVKHPTETQD